VTFLLGACSSYQALNKGEHIDINTIDIGNSKEFVEEKIGKNYTLIDDNGQKLHRYTVKVIPNSSTEKAAGHAIMSVSTFGIWEVAGNILEANDEQRFYIDIQYEDGIVKNLYKKRLEDY
jgi:hypothetical protein